MAEEMSDSSSGDDIFSYRPVKRRKAQNLAEQSSSSGVIVPSADSNDLTKGAGARGRRKANKTRSMGSQIQKKSVKPKQVKRTKKEYESFAAGTHLSDLDKGKTISDLEQQVCSKETLGDGSGGSAVNKVSSNNKTQEAYRMKNEPHEGTKTPNKRGKKSNPAKTPTPRKERKTHQGDCPFCQMPFSVLTIESPRWHAMECMDLPIIAVQECPAGLYCDNTIASHYRKFRHTLLAEKRAGCAAGSQKESAVVEDLSEKKKCLKHLDFEPSTSGTFSIPQRKMEEVPKAPSFSDEESDIEPSSSSITQGGSNTFTTSMIKKSVAAFASVVEKSKAVISSVIEKARTDSNNCKTSERTHVSAELQEYSPSKMLCHKLTVSKLQKKGITPKKNPNSVSKNVSPYFNTSPTSEQCPKILLPKSEPVDENPQNLSETVCKVESSSTGTSIGKIVWDVTDPLPSKQPERVHVKTELDFTERDLHDLLCDSDMEEELHIKSEPHDLAVGTFVEIHNEPSLQMSNNEMSGAESSQDGTSCTILKSAKRCSTTYQRKANLNSPLKQRNAPQKHLVVGKSPLRKSPRLAQTGTKQLSIASFFGGKCQTNPKASTSQNSSSWGSSAALKRKETSKAGPGEYRSSSTQGSDSQSTTSSGYGGTENNSSYRPRSCPFYKKMPGTPFTVDAFRYGNIPDCKAYFLTHFHYDHYGGLTKGFSNPLYCTKITANLVKKKIRVADKFITSIALDTPTLVLGVEVTFLEANHCPGAVLILFKLPNGRVILHTGDFRADVSMQMNPALIGKHIDELYLDTTYCDPQYAFPPQQDVINLAVNIATDFVHMNPNTLIVVGSYTIGKERIFLAIAEALGCKICVTRDKKNVLDCLEDPDIDKRITMKAHDAKLHVLPMKDLRYPALTEYLQKLKPRFDKILGFEPTGWTHNGKKCPALEDIKPKIKSDNIVLYGVPYSEHSSYTELKSFVQFTRPDKILPTVNNGNPTSRKKMEGLFSSWLNEESISGSPLKKMRQSAINSWFRK